MKSIMQALAAHAVLNFALAHGSARIGNAKSQVTLSFDLRSNHSSSIWQQVETDLAIECGAHLQEHPDDIACPSACPFLRMEPTRFCEFKCVVAEACNDDDPMSNFADPETMRCTSCHVSACRRCSRTSRDRCDLCQDGFTQVDGLCISDNRHMWYAVYALIAIGVLVGIVYVVKLVLRPTVNPLAVQQGELFRASSKTRDPATHELFALSRDIRSDDAVAKTVGIGVQLSFRFQGWVLTWCACIVVALLGLRLMFDDREQAQKSQLGSKRSFDACNHAVAQQQSNIAFMEQAFFWVVLVMYVCSFAAALVFAARQHKIYKKTSDRLITMQDYVLLASGLPMESGSENVEGNVKEFIENELKNDVPGLEIIGVSVCWNQRSRLDEVKDHAFQDLEEWDEQHAEQTGDGSTRRSVEQKANAEDEKEKKRVTCCDPSLQCIDFAFGVGSMPCTMPADEEESIQRSETVEALLTELNASGSAFVVCKNEKQRDQVLEAWGEQRTYKESEVVLSNPGVEPESILWDGYGASDAEFQIMLVKGILCVLIAIVLLDVFFYTPYVSYLMSVSDVAGMSQGGFAQGLLLGLLITVCNQIIYMVISWRADLTPFCARGRHEQFYVVGYTWAIFFNTCVDLMTVMLLAKGYDADQSLKMQAAHDSTMSAKAMAESPTMQRSIYVQLIAYLFPGCLLLPFLLEPIATTALPYFLGYNLTRSRKEVSMLNAEGLMACAPFDLSRYGDILINVMLCILTLFFNYREVWLIWVYLFISLVVILVWDHCRLLRFSQHSFFGSPIMAYTSHYMLAFPVGMLASVLAFRVWGASDDGFLEGNDVLDRSQGFLGRNAGMSRETIAWSMGLCFLAHVLVHFAILRWIVPRFSEDSEQHDQEVPYETAASKIPCNWFNANPVHVLRSAHFFRHGSETGDSPCVQFAPGKEYLLKANPKIGLYYEKSKADIIKGIEEEHSASTVKNLKELGLRNGLTAVLKSGA